MGGTGEAITGATRVKLWGTGAARTNKSRHRWIGTRIADIWDGSMGGMIELKLCQTGVNRGVPRRGTHVRIVASGTKRLVFARRAPGPWKEPGHSVVNVNNDKCEGGERMTS